MKSLGLSFFTDTHLTLMGLIIFFVLFIAILFLQLKLHTPSKLQQIKNLPLEGDQS